MITAAGIRAASARLVDVGVRPTIQNVANELHVKAIELEPLMHQMFRDGQLDPSVDTIHVPDLPEGARGAANSTPSKAEGFVLPAIRSGRLTYLEIPALDLQQSASFYEHVFGWMLDSHQANRPGFRDTTGQVAGAWVPAEELTSSTSTLVPYIDVETIDVATELIQAHGGEIVDAPSKVEGVLMATFRDPAGNVLGLRQAPTITPAAT